MRDSFSLCGFFLFYVAEPKKESAHFFDDFLKTQLLATTKNLARPIFAESEPTKEKEPRMPTGKEGHGKPNLSSLAIPALAKVHAIKAEAPKKGRPQAA